MFSRRTAWDVSPNRLAQARRHHQSCGRTAIDLACTNPTALGLVYPEELYAELFSAGSMVYAPEPFGMLSAREAVAQGYYARRGIEVDADQVCLSASTSESYAQLLAMLCDPGDAILVPSPSYPLLDYIAEIARVELIRYPLHYDGHWWVDRARLAELAARHAGRVKALVCVSPNNPTGSFLTIKELEAIEGLCATHDLTLIVDEVFSDYPLHPGPSRVASTVGPRECLTFSLSGLSKVAALPQLKLSWAVASGPDELIRPALARLSVIADTFLNVSTPAQFALPKILPASEAMQARIRRRAIANLQTLDAAITDSPVSRLGVEAGWSTILTLPQLGELDDEGWVLRMLERCDVWAQPGSLFDMPGCHLVLSLLTPPEAFAEGIARLLGLVVRIAGGGRW
ncbi:pyridoxal phosphate-dependent aminotransferase [Pseudenhygromyxa sp. WMMC2535]|uniref:pyridoxal phosphate-dependent aminotransferase n=1 Tax=Pseudenhygromyxa sp. WMMC2535 TaxID=2712867 RepID=UPI00155715D6|nr:pyridoxal phosphate-dependent aminotransferase [Pseudenhygromyxa sp. WMMC2535]NVB43217.1 pyridoxal phosphate-dependent aminotransferase [Pseudenhygromyxa sp. WMMC2535]